MRTLGSALLTVALSACLTASASEPRLAAATVVAGDSVIIELELADNAAPQPVAVDSVKFHVDLGATAGGAPILQRTVTVAKASGTTSGRLAYALDSIWSGGALVTKGGRIGSSLCRNGANPACSTITWKGTTASPAWTFTLDQRPPNPPESATLTLATPAHLN